MSRQPGIVRFPFRLPEWSLRARLAMLLVLVSLVPLIVGAYIDIRQAQARLLDGMQQVLQARADHLVGELDGFHRAHQRSVDRLARFPGTVAFCAGDADRQSALRGAMSGMLSTFPASDPAVGGAALLDRSGKVLIATNPVINGADLMFRPHVRTALQGSAAVSDIHLTLAQTGEQPSISYLLPVRGSDQQVACVALLLVRAKALWDIVKTSNGLAGPGSFAVLFDSLGIRIAHTYSDDIVFHPGGALDAATIDKLVTEQRFGTRTRTLLQDVRAFPEQFERSRASSPDLSVFKGFAPVNRSWNYGVARRVDTVPWTVFYMTPAANIEAQIEQMTRQKTALAGGIIVLALGVGLLVAAGIVRPIRALTAATASIAGGDLSARVDDRRSDELGQLGRSFNAMAERIEQQSSALQRSRDELERRVLERTAELVRTADRLQAEVVERRSAEARLQAQFERLSLLDQITSAISERQDLQSIYQVVVRSLEERLPLDFSCVGRYDALDNTLTVTRVGVHSRTLALELAMSERSAVPIDENGLSRCVQGHLVYEADTGTITSAFPQRLARHGLRSLVVAPLQSESRVFGVLIAARLQPNAFSSGECEFLRQLSAHVALAARQAELYGSLQRAYDDLRQTQHAVMQQERLRALGQMASGIAHDINNAISPILLYTENLLEREAGLSANARNNLETIARAIDDVAATVARMREFYRQREPQLLNRPLSLNHLVQQVVDLTRARWSDMPQQRGIVIRLHTELAVDLPQALGIESEIREALINLVFNAVDAMPEGGELTLRTRAVAASDLDAGASRAQLEVEDTGFGMDDETRRRCLEPFFTTKGERGTGLGLAMVYGTAQRHGADIEIHSMPGRGTTIELRFPTSAMMAFDGPDAPAAADAPAQRLRVLLVDDDPLLLKALQDMLEADGHTVIASNGGQAGIDAFNAALEAGESFSLVVTDLGMPYVDGRKVASAVKRASPETPVILLTGWGQRLVADGDIPASVDHVLSKPPKLRELRLALARHGRPVQSLALASMLTEYKESTR